MTVDDPRVNENLKEVCRAFAKVKDAAFVEEFLRSLMTPAELADIAARWALVKCLQNKKPQREIAHDLGLSLCKITRGSRELKKPDPPFLKMLAMAN
jgi:TrpR family trp operon transcriptional repressor